MRSTDRLIPESDPRHTLGYYRGSSITIGVNAMQCPYCSADTSSALPRCARCNRPLPARDQPPHDLPNDILGGSGRQTLGGRIGARSLVIVAVALIGSIAGITLIALVLTARFGDSGHAPGPLSSPLLETSSAGPPGPPTDLTGPGSGIPAAFDGTWRGLARNQDDVTFPAEVTFRTGRSTAQLTYAGEAQCTTTLTLTSSTPDTITMRLTPAPSCTIGTVTIRTRPDDRLDYAFTSRSGRYTIHATLSRI